MGDNYFHFKQFSVRHDKCAMKVGTDGVLLGAMARIPSPLPMGGAMGGLAAILDLGCGSGLIALMLAQRTKGNSRIVAVDIDSQAAIQARENVAASPWADKIIVLHDDIRRPTSPQLCPKAFDSIVCNPPFYQNSPDAAIDSRNTARRTDTLTHQDLAQAASVLLTDGGNLDVIVPYSAADALIHTCWLHGLNLASRTDIRTTPAKPHKRSVLSFCNSDKTTKVSTNELCLMEEDLSPSNQYRSLTKDFYLKL